MTAIERWPYVLMLVCLVVRLIGPIMFNMALARFLRLTNDRMPFARKMRLLPKATIIETVCIMAVVILIILMDARPTVGLCAISLAYLMKGLVYARLARMIDTGNSKG